jgi:asparagine synthase (glutamine-hydrolysing)
MDWKGYPIRSLGNAAWQVYLLGSLNQPAAALEEPAFAQAPDLSETAAELNGHFLILARNRAEGHWHVWTDRFATLHAYYATDGQRAALGTFSPAVAAAASQRKLDWTGLAGFFGFGFFPGDRTFFEDLRILRPASHYVFDERGRLVRQERTWDWRHTPDGSRSYEDTVAQFAQLFHQVMDDATRQERVAVPVSGGLDSRSTVAAITRGERPLPAGLNLWAYSYSYRSGPPETEIARRVANARGLPFEAYEIQPYLFDQMDRILAWTEGFQDVALARQAYVRDEIAAQADGLVAALWGDVWLDDMGLAGQPASGLDESIVQAYTLAYTLKKMRKRGGEWLLDRLVAPQLKGLSPAELLESLVAEELRPLAHITEPDFRLKAFKTEQWSFRWSLCPVRVFQSAAEPSLVFYDTRLADFFCTLPAEHVAGRRLQIDYLKRYAPDLARIPWQAYDADLFTYQHYNTWLLPRRALKKAWRSLTGKSLIERNWEVQLLGEAGRAGLHDWLLRPGLKLHEYLLPERLTELLEAFYRPPLDPGCGYTVSMLLTFSAWLERYGPG